MTQKRVQRRQSRIVALKALFYFMERGNKKDIQDCFREVTEEIEPQDLPNDFAWKIVSTAVENLPKIKLIIRAFAPEFSFEKIAPINRALLILGVCEMKFMETPPVVVINEYIELAKEFGEGKSASFVNGVLDNYRKSLGLERTKDAG